MLVFVIKKFWWREFCGLISEAAIRTPRVFGDESRLEIHPTAQVNDGLFNLASGNIKIDEYAFFGHGVSVITGSHDPTSFGAERASQFPSTGNDIIIGKGVWIGSNATILGPCRIGDNTVIGAMALVRTDIPSNVIVAGVPARVIRHLDENALVDNLMKS